MISAVSVSDIDEWIDSQQATSVIKKSGGGVAKIIACPFTSKDHATTI